MKISNFRDIFTRKIKIADFAKNNGYSRQYASILMHSAIDKYLESKVYKSFIDKLPKDSGNWIVRVDNLFIDKLMGEFFQYQYKKNIFVINEKIFYSNNIEVKDLNISLKEIRADNKNISLEKALDSMNIKADEEFLDSYIDVSVVYKSKPLDVVVDILQSYKHPISKDELLIKTGSKGIKDSTVLNIIKNTTNNENMILNLGDNVCEKDIFFNAYIDEEYKNKFVIAAVAVCEKNDVCNTDIKWIKGKIEEMYPDINVNKYSPYELKTILNAEDQFKSGVKYNIQYLDKQCQFQPANTKELVIKILENYSLPVSYTYLLKMIHDEGRSVSGTTLNSQILSCNEEFLKIEDSGWILKGKEAKANKLFKVAMKAGAEKVINDLMKATNKTSYKDLCLELNLLISNIYTCLSGVLNIKSLITKIYENGYEVYVDGDTFKLRKLSQEEAK